MAIIFNDEKQRSELQQRIAAELREKQASKSLNTDLRAPEYDNETSAYLKNTKSTTSLAWVWALIGVGAIGTIVAVIIAIN
ncbi:hypothetical protein FWC31_01460 [Candidatus Saccharibacteria bacterium]|nr:hypothetical protein [Candidatus Saccharibacteria bacterium]